MTFDNIKTLHESIPRNHRLVKVLYYNKLFESWGRGIELIVNSCIQAGHPEPEFLERTGGVCVRLMSKQSLASPSLVTQLPAGVSLTKKQKEIFLIIQEHREISLAEIQQKLPKQVTTRAIQKTLKQLKDVGVIKTKGYGRNTLWCIAYK